MARADRLSKRRPSAILAKEGFGESATGVTTVTARAGRPWQIGFFPIEKEGRMSEMLDSLQAGNSVRLNWPELQAAKLGPFPFPVRIAVRAYSGHYQGGGTSTASMKLYYERDLVGDAAGTGDPIDLNILYGVGLLGGETAAFRIDFTNRISTVRDHGFEFTLSGL
jgi:hypothetical protein